MVRIRFVQPGGAAESIEAAVGENLMAATTAAGVAGILAECGGSMVCGTCHVHIAEPWFSQLGAVPAMEAEMIEYALHARPDSRLACQIMVTAAMEDMEVGVPPAQR